jgi:adenosine deaminase
LDRQKIRALITRVPKTEIHLHLEGLASVDTIWNLMQKHGLTPAGITSKEELRDRFQVTSLDEFIDLFINVIQNSFSENDDIELLIGDLRNYLNSNNIVYAEIFFAPSKFLMNGFSFEKMLGILDKGVESIKKKDNREVKFIIDVSRTSGVKNAENNLDLTLKHRSGNIIGIGLGGTESKGPAKDFAHIFEKARKEGLNLVAHAGEVVGPESVWDALNTLHAQRIGHGISSIFDKNLMDYLRDHRIPLEVCPTSNLFTRKFFHTLQDHPVKPFFDHGIFVTINTDDPSIFGKELVEEYMSLIDAEIFSINEVLTLIKNNLYATFLPEDRKNSLWTEAEKSINTFIK